MNPVSIIVPENKGSLHLFFLVLLLCRHYLGGLNPNPLPPCGEQNTSKIPRCNTIFQIFRMEGVDKYSTLNFVSHKESIIIHCTTFIFVQLTSDPCSVFMTLNWLLGEVFYVLWDIFLNALLTLVRVTVFIVWLSKLSVRLIKCVTSSFLELLREDIIIFLAGCCNKSASLSKLLPKITCILANLCPRLLQEVGDKDMALWWIHVPFPTINILILPKLLVKKDTKPVLYKINQPSV